MKRLVLAGIVILSAAAGGATVAAPADPAQASYDMAFGLTRAGSFGLAESAWRSFLSKYPDHPLAGNAQYFLGETFYDRRDFARAAIAFGVGAEKYPKSEMAAPTLLKLGIALGRSGETAQACDAFARLHRQFPELGGVIRERALVEARQYRCAEAAAAPPAGAAPSAPAVKLAAAPAAHDTAPLPPAPPSVIAAPAPVAPATPAAAAPPPGTSVPDRSGEPLKAAEAKPAPTRSKRPRRCSPRSITIPAPSTGRTAPSCARRSAPSRSATICARTARSRTVSSSASAPPWRRARRRRRRRRPRRSVSPAPASSSANRASS